MLCSCQNGYRSDAAGALKYRRETHVLPPPGICALHLDAISLRLLLSASSFILSTFEPVSSFNSFSHFERSHGCVLAANTPAPILAVTCTLHNSELRDLNESLPCSSPILRTPPRITSHRQPGAYYNNRNHLNVWLRC